MTEKSRWNNYWRENNVAELYQAPSNAGAAISARDKRMRLYISRKNAEKDEGRIIKCPECGSTLLYAYSHCGVIFVKCKKCRLTNPKGVSYER